jgi:hypothetical protein
MHAKIANRRKDFLHPESTRIVKEYGLVVVGNASGMDLHGEARAMASAVAC